MKNCLMLAIALVLVCGAVLLSRSAGQVPPQPNAAQPGAGEPAAPSVIYRPTPQAGYGTPRFSPAQGEINELMSQLRETDDEAKKAELTKKLEAAVAKHFDEDLKVRETELTKLEERLKKLQSQLERRRKAKAEIIQLQIKVLVNEAEGLGFWLRFLGASSLDHGDVKAQAAPVLIRGR